MSNDYDDVCELERENRQQHARLMRLMEERRLLIEMVHLMISHPKTIEQFVPFFSTWKDSAIKLISRME